MGSFLEDGAGMSFLTARFACGFPTQAFKVGEIGLVSGRRSDAGAGFYVLAQRCERRDFRSDPKAQAPDRR